jgi:hypothetical protein
MTLELITIYFGILYSFLVIAAIIAGNYFIRQRQSFSSSDGTSKPSGKTAK